MTKGSKQPPETKGSKPPPDGLGEFEIIARYFAPLATLPASLELRDDCAVLAIPDGQEIIATCDTIIEGVHFRADDPADTIGHKALAVNLSDLAAKGARPLAYLLSVALPSPSGDWLQGFAAGLKAIQEDAGCSLIGGDTSESPGPLTITVTALGLVRRGHSVLRRGAKAGDRLYVTGTIGDAALGLRLLATPKTTAAWGLSKDDAAYLVDRYRRPQPRGKLAQLLRNAAHAAIDISDGLAGDIEKLCRVSRVSAEIEFARVPLSAAAAKAVAKDADLLQSLIAAGDDYEIVAAVPEAGAATFEAEAAKLGIDVTAIGQVKAGPGEVAILDEKGAALELPTKGFSHF